MIMDDDDDGDHDDERIYLLQRTMVYFVVNTTSIALYTVGMV